MKNTAPSPFEDGAFNGNFGPTIDLFKWQRLETADSPYQQATFDPYSSQQTFDSTTQPGGHGQGQYTPSSSNLPQAWHERHEEREAIWNEGFDYGVHD